MGRALSVNPITKGTGSSELAAGTATVADTRVQAGDIVIPSAKDSILNAGSLAVTNITPGVGFTVTSTNILDARAFDYVIIKV